MLLRRICVPRNWDVWILRSQNGYEEWWTEVIFDLDKQNAHGSVPRMASHVADNG